MNTVSLVLNGRTAADIALLPERQRSSITTLPTRKSLQRALSDLSTVSPPPSPMLLSRKSNVSSAASSGYSTPRTSFSMSRPSLSSSRRSSKGSNSPGWYYEENNPTLDDIARRLNTTSKKFEIWQTRCAQNVVMALMRPTPLILFVLNPICLIIWVVLAICWLKAG